MTAQPTENLTGDYTIDPANSRWPCGLTDSSMCGRRVAHNHPGRLILTGGAGRGLTLVRSAPVL